MYDNACLWCQRENILSRFCSLFFWPFLEENRMKRGALEKFSFFVWFIYTTLSPFHEEYVVCKVYFNLFLFIYFHFSSFIFYSMSLVDMLKVMGGVVEAHDSQPP